MKLHQFKPGYSINHPVHGYLRYKGLVTKHAFTKEPKVPHQYLFWKTVDEKGKLQPDVILTNGLEEFEIVEICED